MIEALKLSRTISKTGGYIHQDEEPEPDMAEIWLHESNNRGGGGNCDEIEQRRDGTQRQPRHDTGAKAEADADRHHGTERITQHDAARGKHAEHRSRCNGAGNIAPLPARGLGPTELRRTCEAATESEDFEQADNGHHHTGNRQAGRHHVARFVSGDRADHRLAGGGKNGGHRRAVKARDDFHIDGVRNRRPSGFHSVEEHASPTPAGMVLPQIRKNGFPAQRWHLSVRVYRALAMSGRPSAVHGRSVARMERSAIPGSPSVRKIPDYARAPSGLRTVCAATSASPAPSAATASNQASRSR
ncbi:hypothetical protein ABIF93_000579 [Bradyrhizobium japonicum]